MGEDHHFRFQFCNIKPKLQPLASLSSKLCVAADGPFTVPLIGRAPWILGQRGFAFGWMICAQPSWFIGLQFRCLSIQRCFYKVYLCKLFWLQFKRDRSSCVPYFCNIIIAPLLCIPLTEIRFWPFSRKLHCYYYSTLQQLHVLFSLKSKKQEQTKTKNRVVLSILKKA